MVRKPIVRVHYLRPVVKNDGKLSEYEVIGLYANGKNVGSSDYLVGFKYNYEIEGSDSCDITFNFNTIDLDLTVFQEGVRLAVSWGYVGYPVAIRDLVIDKVKGRYSSSGYQISLSLIPPIAYANKYDNEGDISERLGAAGGYIEYEYYNADTGENIIYKYYPQDNSYNIDGNVRKYRPGEVAQSPLPKASPASFLRGTEMSPTAVRMSPSQAEAYGIEVNDRTPEQKTHLKDGVALSLSRYMAMMGVREAVVMRDDKMLMAHNTYQKAPLKAFSVGPSESFERAISFSFDSGKDSSTSEEDADIELAVIDPNYKTDEKIKITKEWRIKDPETGAFETFNVVKKDGVFYYESDGRLLNKLNSQEILRLKKVELRYNYNEYQYGEQVVKDELDKSKAGSFNTNNVPGRDLVTVKESAYEVDKMRGAENVRPQDKPLMDKILFNDSYSARRHASQRQDYLRDKAVLSEGFAKQYVRRVTINGVNFDDLVQKGVQRKLDSIFHNIVTELTVKGDPGIESNFTYVVANAGYGISGKYRCIKSSHQIQSGKYTLTIHGAKIPPDVSVVIDSVKNSVESSVRQIEVREEVFKNLGLISSVVFSSQGETFIQSTQVPGVANLLKGVNILSSDLKFSDNPKPIEGKRSTNTAVANTPEELDEMKKNPQALQEAKSFEIYTQSRLNDRNARFSTISKTKVKETMMNQVTGSRAGFTPFDPNDTKFKLKQFSTVPPAYFEPNE